MHTHKRIFIISFLTPAVLIYSLFFVYPMAKAFYICLYRWRGISVRKVYIGLDNFKKLFHDGIFWISLEHNLYIVVLSLFLLLTISLFFAIVLTKVVKRSGFYKTVYFFPNILSEIIIAVLWAFIYNPSFGIFNGFLELIGLSNLTRAWLGDRHAALTAVTIPGVWRFIGFYMIFFIAGIQNIPQPLYDAGKIDGTSEWQSFWFITIPLLWEQIKVAAVYIIIIAFNTFTIVFLMTRGGPNRHTEVVTTYLYEHAFQYSSFGYATAIGVVLFIVMFSASWFAIRVMKKEIIEY